MKMAKNALKRFWTRARGLGKRRRESAGDEGESPKARGDGDGFPWRLIPLACALAASVAVFATLMNCEHGAYAIPIFGTSSCASWSQTFGFLSTSAGVGFLVFLMTEVVTVILAQMWIDKQRDRAERRAEAAECQADAAERQTEVAERQADAAERRAEVAERQADAAERRAESAERMMEQMEQARREDAERAERREDAAERREEAADRRAEAAERRELRLIELIESLKNGKDNGSK